MVQYRAMSLNSAVHRMNHRQNSQRSSTKYRLHGKIPINGILSLPRSTKVSSSHHAALGCVALDPALCGSAAIHALATHNETKLCSHITSALLTRMTGALIHGLPVTACAPRVVKKELLAAHSALPGIRTHNRFPMCALLVPPSFISVFCSRNMHLWENIGDGLMLSLTRPVALLLLTRLFHLLPAAAFHGHEQSVCDMTRVRPTTTDVILPDT